jgi:hypothetical protein
LEDAKYGNEAKRKSNYFNSLAPPYFFRAVRSFGEYTAETGEFRHCHRFGSQELFARKPANIGDFERSELAERALPEG